MKHMILKSIALLFVFSVVFVANTWAQGPAPPPAPNEVPLDGFSALLLAAGAGYGAYKTKGRKSGGKEGK